MSVTLQDDAELRPEDVVKVDGFGITEGAQAAGEGKEDEEDEEQEDSGANDDEQGDEDGEEDEEDDDEEEDEDGAGEQGLDDQIIEEAEIGWEDI
jgi:hypothetical protein